ncbi:MAG: hypothetical protein OXF73_12620 [Gammaproteobacteria bacterium]|nr:hypothetical protein [Gammaproteobacteria bacterium]MCY4227664.1 hypothetical protein [Gammaproteobacteria bacterium]
MPSSGLEYDFQKAFLMNSEFINLDLDPGTRNSSSVRYCAGNSRSPHARTRSGMALLPRLDEFLDVAGPELPDAIFRPACVKVGVVAM